MRRIWKQIRRWRGRKILVGIVVILVLALAALYPLYHDLKTRYASFLSRTIYDRNGEIIAILPSSRGNYASEIQEYPQKLKELLIRKEDRWFYLHPGINPFAIIRDMTQAIWSHKFEGSSTLTQQTVKILLAQENRRTLNAKIREVPYALALGLFASKENILRMYGTIAPLGNQASGFEEAARYYFGKPVEALSEAEILSLLAALNNPSGRSPGSPRNERFLPKLANALHLSSGTLPTVSPGKYPRRTNTAFELSKVMPECIGSCTLAVDANLTESLRNLLRRNLDSPWLKGVKNGAIVVIRTNPPSPEASAEQGTNENANELLAIVGSPSPTSGADGMQINMAVEPRPVGSTAKPFIYGQAFEMGARPYSLVDDREYRYVIDTGFGFYPKNYDGLYRGLVTLHQALANSLNVPAVKVLEFAGLSNFANLLVKELGFHPRQPLESYGLGIALGGLEVDPLTFTNWFTIFPNQGKLKPLVISRNSELATLKMGENTSEPKEVFPPQITELVTKILSDRATAVDQFGAAGNLYLTAKNYAVKTGTTYDYHDSWTVGYTPDLVVGVWLGNSDNSPIREISGQAGAGRVWRDVMQFMVSTPYYTSKPFDYSRLATFTDSGTLEYGLPNDNYAEARQIMLSEELILSPHDGDEFLLLTQTLIPLKASRSVRWTVDGKFLETGTESVLRPTKIGEYVIGAEDASGKTQRIDIQVNKEGL